MRDVDLVKQVPKKHRDSYHIKELPFVMLALRKRIVVNKLLLLILLFARAR